MKRVWILACLLVFALALAGCNGDRARQNAASDYQKVRLVMTVNGTDIGIDTLVARQMIDMVKKESGGNVSIELYIDDQLAGGNTTRAVDMLADGSVDMAAYVSCNMAALDHRLSVAAIPWTFENYQEARKVIDSSGGAFYEKVLAGQGLTYLGSTHNGLRQLSNNVRPVRTLEDIAGLKIRVMGGDIYLWFFEDLGALPTPMSWSELPMAIRQGTVDGQENGIYLTNSAKINELQKYMTIWNYTYENYIFVANSKIFNQLEPKTQALIREKTREACEWGRDRLEADEKYMLAKFVDNGMEVTVLSEEGLVPFKEQVRPLIDKLKAYYGHEACAAFGIQ